MERRRVITWSDPAIAAQAAGRMSGLEYLRAIKRGDIPPPPAGTLVGVEFVDLEEGRTTFRFTPGEHHYNTIGSVHGGIITTLLDSAAGSAVHTLLTQGTGYTTLEIKVNFLRAASRETGPLTAEGRIIHLGSRIALAESRLVDQAGQLYAHAVSTCLLLRPETRPA